jgi:hypothetical protein
LWQAEVLPGSDIDVPDIRSEYADDPELLIATASSQVDYMSNSLDVASVSNVMDELSSKAAIPEITGVTKILLGTFEPPDLNT